MRIDVFIHQEPDERFGQILDKLDKIQQKEILVANELETLTQQVTANTDAEASAIVLLQNLHDLLVAAGTDPTKLTALADTLKTSQEALAAAIVANTPAAP